jgi:hypothetical protein
MFEQTRWNLCVGVLKVELVDGSGNSGLPEVRLIYRYVKLRAPSLINV